MKKVNKMKLKLKKSESKKYRLSEFSNYYKLIPNHESYIISSDAKIYSFKRHKFLKFDIVNNYYYRVIIDNDRYLVHRLVYITFSDSLLNADEEIHHIDNNSFNNCYDNLIAVNHADHMKLHKQDRDFYKSEMI